MAATRLIAMHINKGKTLAQCLEARTDYAQNPEKTEKGNLISAYECDPMTCDEEFLLSKRQYRQFTGREQKGDVIAYQIRQSFKPGEVTAEEANRIGYELAMAITKGKHAFIVATHTDRPHYHNHIIFNSTSLDCLHKFRDFKHSGLALQHISDRICLEHGLSVIEPKPYKDRLRRSKYPKRPRLRDDICNAIDKALEQKPKNFEEFLSFLEAAGYEIKRGKQIALKGKDQQRFIRLRSLGDGYTEEDIRNAISGAGRYIRSSHSRQVHKRPGFNLLIDIQEKIQGKGAGYERWAKVFNLKQLSQAVLYLKEHGDMSYEELQERTTAAVTKFNELSAEIKDLESQMSDNGELQKQIVNYAKTRTVYAEYRKAGYSKKFREAHEAEILIHQAAKKYFDSLGTEKLPSVKVLREEYSKLLARKRKAYAEYKAAREEMKELYNVKSNVEHLLNISEPEPEREREKTRR